eukprot:gene1586-3064_t
MIDQIFGLDDLLHFITLEVLQPSSPDIGIEKSSPRMGLIVEGGSGGGKTTLLRALEYSLKTKMNVTFFDCSELPEHDGPSSAAMLLRLLLMPTSKHEHINQESHKQTLFLLDNIDICAPATSPGTSSRKPSSLSSFHAMSTSALVFALDSLRRSHSDDIRIVCTVSSSVSVTISQHHPVVSPLLTTSHRLGAPITLPLPTLVDRYKFLVKVLSLPAIRFESAVVTTSSVKKSADIPVDIDVNVNIASSAKAIARMTEGFSISYLIKLVTSVLTPIPRPEVDGNNYIPNPNHHQHQFSSCTWVISDVCLRQRIETSLPSSLTFSQSQSHHPPLPMNLLSNTSSSSSSPVCGCGLVGPVAQSNLIRLTRTVLGDRDLHDNVDNGNGNVVGVGIGVGIGVGGKSSRLKLSPCSGILIHGPSGVGKTALAQAICAACGTYFRFINISCADLVHKVVGESEKKIAALFNSARQIAPCILVLDDLDAVFGGDTGGDSDGDGDGDVPDDQLSTGPRRGQRRGPGRRRTAHAALDRLLSTLLIELDGMGSESGTGAWIETVCSGSQYQSQYPETKTVVVIATCSRIDSLDRSLTRPGRLEEHVALSMPDKHERKAVLEALLPKFVTTGDDDSTAISMTSSREDTIEKLVLHSENRSNPVNRQHIKYRRRNNSEEGYS